MKPVYRLSALALLLLGCAAVQADPAPDALPAAAAVPPATVGSPGATGSDDDAARASADDPQQIVAQVGDAPIRLEDLLDWVRGNPTAFSTFGARWGRVAVLNEVIKESLLDAAAAEAYADDPAALSLPAPVLRARYRRQFLSPALEISDDVLRAFYDEHRARFGIPPMVRIRELFFPKPAMDDPAQARATAWSVYEQLLAGASIDELAREHAPDLPSRAAGGDRGFVSVIERPQLAELTADMAIGSISEPFELPTGYSIIQLLDRRSGVAAPFDAVRSVVKGALIAEREGDLIEEFLNAQARAHGVEILLPEYAEAWPSLPPAPPANQLND